MICFEKKNALFKYRGRAEPIRMLLAACGQKYEDDRIEQSDWPSIKPTFPFGQVKIHLIFKAKRKPLI